MRLPRFFIARYLVTVAQWRVYYEAVDAEDRKTLDPPSVAGISNYPAVYVSCHDAHRYCRWLTGKMRESTLTPEPLVTLLRHGDGMGRPWVVTLPSEAEWEKTARGRDGRHYPWGDTWDPNRANHLKI